MTDDPPPADPVEALPPSIEVLRPVRPSRQATPQSNLGTAAALFAMVFAALVVLAVLSAVGFGFVGMLVLAIPLGLGLLTLFHYVTWGWWLSQLRDDDEPGSHAEP